MGYGFRVHSFDVVTASKRKKLDLCDAESPFEDYLQDLLGRLGRQSLLMGLPGRPEPWEIGDVEDTRTVDGTVRRGRGTAFEKDLEGLAPLAVSVVSGHISQRDYILGHEALDSIKDKVTGDALRTQFLMPASGTTGVVVSEVRANQSHTPALLRWISWQSYELTQDRTNWAKLITHPLTDGAYLRDLINNAKKTEVVLKRTRRGAARERIARTQTLTLKGFDEDVIRQIAEEASSWPRKSMATAIDALAPMVGVDRGSLRKGGLDLDKTAIKLETADGRHASVIPSQLEKMFTYPLTNESRPGEAQWREALARARDLAKIHEIDLK